MLLKGIHILCSLVKLMHRAQRKYDIVSSKQHIKKGALDMKLGRILRASLEGSVPRLVAVQPEQGRVIDLASAEYERLLRGGATPEAAQRMARAFFPASMAAAIGSGPLFLEAAQRCIASVQDERSTLSLESLTWLAPIDPPVMRDCLTFETHLRNSFVKLLGKVPEQYYEMPLYYKGNPLTLVGHEQEILWPDYTRRMDYELELGFIVGRSGRDLTPEQAKAHLFGVTIFNDFSARDIQANEMQGLLGPAKGKDFATALGPWITTANELDAQNLTMIARVKLRDDVEHRGDSGLHLEGRGYSSRRSDRIGDRWLRLRTGVGQATQIRRCRGT